MSYTVRLVSALIAVVLFVDLGRATTNSGDFVVNDVVHQFISCSPWSLESLTTLPKNIFLQSHNIVIS